MARPNHDPSGGSGQATGTGMAGLTALKVPRGPHTSPAPVPTSRRGMLRYRLLPRSVLGASMMILAFAVGAGFSGVVLFSYYQYKLTQTDQRVNALIGTYQSQFAKAEADLRAQTAAERAQIAAEAKGVQALTAGPSQIAALVKKVAPSTFFVHTLDANGQPSVGTAFVVSSNSSQSLLITSYTTVAAATHAPAPPVYLTAGSGSDQTPVTVRTWDSQNDLALLVTTRPDLPALPVAPASPAPAPGDRLFAVSGLGTAGASVSQGSVIDVSSGGLALDTPIGPAFQGGPIVNSTGQVVAVGSRAYAPLGFTSDGVYFVPYVQSACAKVLSCPGGKLVGG